MAGGGGGIFPVDFEKCLCGMSLLFIYTHGLCRNEHVAVLILGVYNHNTLRYVGTKGL